ncbi:MAG: Unknown protein [uncultured Sulfurovum sp.]|uniref:DUF4276 family protein n=1 Tax=uncultured Sulfurovum sp. TaxID=269237 RepID=A0A6S6UEQ1_9BACT|nr:MAG: Unknown protein [uncultured Sulfurovum sp.]
MRRKKKRTPSSKSNTILLIVENSEVEFFNKYFKAYLKNEESILVDCIRSSTAGKCEITNGNKMTNKVHASLLDDGYKAVFIMIDLDTKCFDTERNHDCLLKLKNEYAPRYKIDKKLEEKFYLFVVCNEIESWFLTIDKNRNNTNSINEDHKKVIKKLFNVQRETDVLDKVLAGLNTGKYQLDFNKNDSLQHFIKKLKEFNSLK